MKHKKTLFIFRRDLRLEDNTALIEALKNSKEVICVFIFNKKQIGKENEYRSLNSMQILKNSLIELDEELRKKGSKLYMFEDRIDNVIKSLKVDAIYLNKDYSPFARKRDMQIKEFCESKNISFNSFHDALLVEPKKSLKVNGEPYTIFTPFFKKNRLERVNFPQVNDFKNYFKGEIQNTLEKFPKEFDGCLNTKIALNGGRKEALNILKNIKI